jgi:hypothetical protein
MTTAQESNLVRHAQRELELCGQSAEDPDFAKSIIEAIRAYTSYYGHSGGSHIVAVGMLHDLLMYKNLSPLTSDPDEWIDRSEMSDRPLWQNVRNPSVFSEDSGETWYDVANYDDVTDDEPDS